MIFILLSVLIITSCIKRKDRTSEIAQIEKMQLRVDSAYKALGPLNLEDVLMKIKIIKADLKFAQDSAKRAITLKEGIEFDKYKDIYKLFKSYPIEDLPQAYMKNTQQLIDFKKMLEIKATEDKNGNEITEEYLDNNFAMEMRMANQYIEGILEVEKRIEKFNTRYNEMKPKIDSLTMEITIAK